MYIFIDCSFARAKTMMYYFLDAISERIVMSWIQWSFVAYMELNQVHEALSPRHKPGTSVGQFYWTSEALSVRPSTRPSRIDLGNGSKDFSETLHEVGGQ